MNVAHRSADQSLQWLRAEILGAFFNAVFLIALCVSIILEALTRFLNPPEIKNPQLILIVGCLGLASNLAGFLVLGGHGHAHGSGEHAHGDHHHEVHTHDRLDSKQRRRDLHHNLDGLAEQGQAGSDVYQNPAGGRGHALPESAVAKFQAVAANSRADGARSQPPERAVGWALSNQQLGRNRRRAGSVRHSRLASIEGISIHPASFRQEIIDASRPRDNFEDETSGSETADENPFEDEEPGNDEPAPGEGSPLLKKPAHHYGGHGHSSRSAPRRPRQNSGVHNNHNHNKPKHPGKKSSGGHGHSHDDMGMNAMILHVLGDALGNVGVIVTALIIWLTELPGRYYADPAVSLLITLIILRTAIPLTLAASRILLQATPESIDLNEVREDIQALPGVISCHHVHIWQLSDTQIVASLHVQVAFPISAEGGEKYMALARMARKCLHAYGIHSATIQPEFCLEPGHDHGEDAGMRLDGSAGSMNIAPTRRGAGSVGTLTASASSATATNPVIVGAATKCGFLADNPCLLECVDDCVARGCCAGVGGSSPHGSHHHEPAHGDAHRDAHEHGDHDHDPHGHRGPHEH